MRTRSEIMAFVRNRASNVGRTYKDGYSNVFHFFAKEFEDVFPDASVKCLKNEVATSLRDCEWRFSQDPQLWSDLSSISQYADLKELFMFITGELK